MKKTITLFSTIIICITLNAQINPSQSTNGIMKPIISNKVTMSGDEALNHLIVNPNPTTSARLKSVTSTETLIGTTTYDLQSNASVQSTRIIMHHNGSISAGWTMSQQYQSSYTDRGTGYNYFDYPTASWGTQPTNRLEASRGGWPSIIVMGSGKEASITHNTDYSYVNMIHRPTTGTGNWTESIVSTQDSTGTYRYMIWNRSAVGGLSDETIHMIALTAPVGNAGALYNGLDGALLYYRSQDEGVTWDKQDIQLPSIDTSMFKAMSGDVYSIDAQGETVVIAYFDDWGDSFILKSNDNGDTWTRTTFLDFPVDKYSMDDGLDLDGDLVMDMVYSTDNSGTVILDENNKAHVFVGNMAYLDDDLADASFSWFPGTNGLLYWNEDMGTDTTPPYVHAGDTSLWYSDLMPVIAQAPDLNGDGLVAGIDSTGLYALYYTSRSSMPNAGISAGNGEIYVSFSGYTETTNNGVQVFRHIYITKSSDGGMTWKTPVDVTPHSIWAGAQECVFGSMNKVVDDKIRIVYQKDFEPGLAVRGDEDPIDINEIIYLEIDTVGLFDIPAANTNIDNSFDFSIYPNPAGNNTTLQISSKITNLITLDIIDILGENVYTENIELNTGLNIKQLDISSLKTGIYFINTTLKDKTISKKLIITK